MLAVSFLSLGWRTGIVVATSVPLVLAIVFVVMNLMGLDLHRITLGALIIALGLLVDDAIIAVEMMIVKMEQGFDRLKAASFAWDSTAFPMLTGTLITAAGFLPIGLAASGVRRVRRRHLLDRLDRADRLLVRGGDLHALSRREASAEFRRASSAERQSARDLRDAACTTACGGSCSWCVDHRIKVVVATVIVFVASIVAFGRVQQQFFPLSERPELFLQLRMPEGTAFNVTSETAKKAEKLLEGDKDITTYTTYVGQGSPRFWLGLNPQLPNESFAEIVIVLEGRGGARAHQGADREGGRRGLR